MAKTVGRVEIIVDANGDRTPAQARRIAHRAGKEAGDEFGKEFEKGSGKGAERAGKSIEAKLGPAGTRTAKKFAAGFTKTLQGEDWKKLNPLLAMDGGTDTSKIILQVNSLAQQFEDLGRVRKDDARAAEQQARANAALEKTSNAKAIRDVANSMKLQTRAREQDARAAEQQARADERAAKAVNTQAIRNVANSMKLQTRARLDAEKAALAQSRAEERQRVGLERLERQLARTFNNPRGIETYSKQFLSLGQASDRLKADLLKLERAGRISTAQFSEMSRTVDRTVVSLERGSSSTAKMSKSVDNLNGRYRQMPYLLKTIIGYTTLFAALGGPIAALGSVAGSSLVTLATAAGALGVGVGVLIAGFRGMTGDLEKVAPAARPAAQALQDMGTEFTKLQDFLQGRMFDGLGPQIEAMAASIMPALQAGLGPIADVLNNLMGQIATALATPEGAAELQGLLEGFAPILQGLGDGFLQFGGALSAILTAALPVTEAFAQGFAEMGAQFNAFLRSAEGQQALSDFFGTLQTLMPTIIDLVGAAGTALAHLVTPQTVEALNLALQAFVQFMPVLSDLLDAVAQLNAFGIIAEIFNVLTAVLTPLMPIITQLANSLGTMLVSALQQLTPVFSLLGQAIAPILQVLVDIVEAVLPPLLAILPTLLQAVMPIVGAVASLVQAFAPFLAIAAQLVAEILPPLVEALVPILTAVIGIATSVLQALLPAFSSLIGALAPIIAEVLPMLGELLMAVFEAVEPLIPVVLELVEAFLPLLPPIASLIGELLPPLIDFLMSVVKDGLTPLIGTLAEVVAAFIPLVSTIVDAVIPIIGDLTKILGGLIDFITGVFTGNWEQAWNGIKDIFSGVWDLIGDAATGAMDIVVGAVNTAIGLINSLLGLIDKISGGAIDLKIPKIPKFASGGVLSQPTLSIAGEAGPEAYVPLNRPLSQVDPSVRALSAFAQGKYEPTEIVGGGGKQVTFTGDITLEAPNTDPELAAESWADKIIEKL